VEAKSVRQSQDLTMADISSQPEATTQATYGPSASVIVKNVAPTTEPPTHKVLSDFFSFCGNISALSVSPAVGDETTVTAVVTFESEAAAKTAVLLNNALISDRAITVELAPPGFQPPSSSVSVDQLPHSALPNQRSEASVIQAMLDSGYKLSADAIAQAKAFDDSTGISATLSTGFAALTARIDEIDQSLQLSTQAKALGDSIASKAAEINNDLQISTKAGEVGGATLNFFQQTANTIATGATAAFQTTTTTLTTGVTSATDSVANFVNTNAQVTEGVQTISAVGASLGQTLSNTWGSFISAVSNATGAQASSAGAST